MSFDDRTVVGLTEMVIIHYDQGKTKEVLARVDSGATKSSIDLTVASKLRLGPVVGSKVVKSAHGSKLRPMIEVEMSVKNRRIKELFTLADRAHMKYPILIGQNILKEGFLIDPSINPGKEEWEKRRDGDNK